MSRTAVYQIGRYYRIKGIQYLARHSSGIPGGEIVEFESFDINHPKTIIIHKKQQWRQDRGAIERMARSYAKNTRW